MPDRTHFSPALFGFLRELADNNDREWFERNKARYEQDVREPALRFVMDYGPRLGRLSEHFRADPRKSGGSLFRIHRDVRFSADKSPFKTYTGIQFRHRDGRDAHAPGFYLHLQPGECFMGAGMWRPDGATTRKVREAMTEDPDGWLTVADGAPLRPAFDLAGDRLKRPPRGFEDADPRLAEHLKWKDFIAVRRLTEDEVTAPGFLDDFAESCAAAGSYVSWLCGAVGVPY